MKGDGDGDVDDETVVEEHFDSRGLWVPGGFMRDHILDGLMAAPQCVPLVVDLSLLEQGARLQ
jgi:hypothetical protein